MVKRYPDIYASSILSIAEGLVKHSLHKDYKQIFKLTAIYLTIPATSVSAERAFSCLKRLKTWLRSSMNQERLSSLAIINIEQELSKDVNKDSIIDNFASFKNRKMLFK